MTLRRLSLLAATIFLCAACSDHGPVGDLELLTATLVSPNGAEGAAVIVLYDVAGVLAPVGDTEIYQSQGAALTRLVLINQVGGALSFEVPVPSGGVPPIAIVQQVAGPDDELRTSLSGYRVEFTP